MGRAFSALPVDQKEKAVNKIEELEERCEQLEDRLEALEKALVAALARPAPRTVVVEQIRPVRRSEVWLNGVPLHRGAEWPDSETFKVHDGVTWYGGQ